MRRNASYSDFSSLAVDGKDDVAAVGVASQKLAGQADYVGASRFRRKVALR